MDQETESYGVPTTLLRPLTISSISSGRSKIHVGRRVPSRADLLPRPALSQFLTSPGKQPSGGKAWHEHALEDPPRFVRVKPSPDALNTGAMCNGLYVFDLDIDDARSSQRFPCDRSAAWSCACQVSEELIEDHDDLQRCRR